MIARLIESGQMQWSDTVGNIFPEASVHEDWKLCAQAAADRHQQAHRRLPQKRLAKRLRLDPNAPKRVERRC